MGLKSDTFNLVHPTYSTTVLHPSVVYFDSKLHSPLTKISVVYNLSNSSGEGTEISCSVLEWEPWATRQDASIPSSPIYDAHCSRYRCTFHLRREFRAS